MQSIKEISMNTMQATKTIFYLVLLLFGLLIALADWIVDQVSQNQFLLDLGAILMPIVAIGLMVYVAIKFVRIMLDK